jgi:hypothetical protein
MCGEDCCCGHGGEACDCQGDGPHKFHRRYQTRAEQLTELEGYLAELKAEVQAVEERLADLRR